MKHVPTIKELQTHEKEPDPCPLCERPNRNPSDHHLVPRTRGGKVTETICQDCHSAIHATFSNKQLEREYATTDALLSHEGFATIVRFIAKQAGKVKTRLNKNQRKRGRNG
jgi:hypothetical protein